MTAGEVRLPATILDNCIGGYDRVAVNVEVADEIVTLLVRVKEDDMFQLVALLEEGGRVGCVVFVQGMVRPEHLHLLMELIPGQSGVCRLYMLVVRNGEVLQLGELRDCVDERLHRQTVSHNTQKGDIWPCEG